MTEFISSLTAGKVAGGILFTLLGVMGGIVIEETRAHKAAIATIQIDIAVIKQHLENHVERDGH